MIKVGITGGIGSGKTTVCRIFEQLGVPVFYADEESKKILDNSEVINSIVKAFGTSVLDDEGGVNKKKLAELVFSNEVHLKKLNSILHPAVAGVFATWLQKQSKHKYVIKEAAILFESGANRSLDKTINVHAPDELRIQRVMQRDKVERNSVVARMKNQLSEEERNKLVDFVIINDGKEPVIPQVLKIHEYISSLSSD